MSMEAKQEHTGPHSEAGIKVEARLASGEWAGVMDGARVKVVTDSIRRWADQESARLRQACGLDEPMTSLAGRPAHDAATGGADTPVGPRA